MNTQTTQANTPGRTQAQAQALIPRKRTNSLWPAAYCLTQGVKLLCAVKEPGQRATWILDDTDGAAGKALDDWYAGDPLVGAKSFLAARSILLDASLNTQNDDDKE